MSGRNSKRAFVARPSEAEAWIRKPDPIATSDGKGNVFTARLTIDVTPEQRGRIKVVAFQRGLTVADMLVRLMPLVLPISAAPPLGVLTALLGAPFLVRIARQMTP